MKILEVIDMAEVAKQEIYEDINANPHLYENLQGSKDFSDLTNLLVSDDIIIGQYYSPLILKALPPAYILDIGGYNQMLELVDIINDGNQYVLADNQGRQVTYPETSALGDILLKTYLYNSVQKADSIVTFIHTKLNNWTIKDSRK